MLKLGAQLYTLREYTKSEDDFAGTIKKVADIGYKYVQVSGIGASISADFIKKVSDSHIKMPIYLVNQNLLPKFRQI